MNQLVEFFSTLFDAADFPPRWHCGRWTEFHGWFYILSDLLIWSAYFAIPVIIVNYITKRKGVRFHRIYFLFAAFILACGTTHLMDVITFWYPAYRLSALIRFVTGVLSWATVFALFKVLPTAFNLKTPQELEQEAEQRRKAEEALKVKNKQLTEAQELAKMGNWEWDVKNKEITWSDGMKRILEIGNDTPASYEYFMSRVHPEEKDYVEQHIRSMMKSGRFQEYYHRIVFADGREKTLHARGEIMTDESGEVTRMIGTETDVTELKKAEASLLQKQKELELMNEELQQFAYAASHDLQEPLRKMRVFIDMMRTKTGDKEAVDLYASRVQAGAERMSTLIKSILEYSRLANRNQLYEAVDLNLILKNVKNDLELLITEKNATIKSDVLPTVYGIEQQMQQLFTNLIHNAIKFSPEKPEITISSQKMSFEEVRTNSSLDPTKRYVMLSFTDHGVGFEPEFASHIFTMFRRLDQQYEGTGIGLSICKKIVDNHRGYISASSAPGKGARFDVCLPII